jgi:anaerobic magnesium-protoporphyrin IX monomethyl ester cyclase
VNVTFISPSPHLNKIHAYGVRLLSACLKRAGCDVDIIFLPRQLGELYSPHVLDQIVELTARANLIGLSLMTDDFENAVLITDALKRASRAPIIWGGIHPTLLPRECLKHADMVCVGEGEDALVELVARMSSGEDYRQVAGIWFRDGEQITINPLRPLIQDLDRLPYPDYDSARHYVLYEGEIQPLSSKLLEVCLKEYYLTLTTRGCPSHCTYCWNHAYNKIFSESNRIRKRSVDHVIGELKAIATSFPFIELICIDDDAFFMRTNEDIEEFSLKYKEHVRIPMWVTGAAPLTITPRKLEALADAGLVAIRMGIQSGSSRTKKLYQRQHSNQSVLKAVHLLDRYRDKIKRRQFDVILDNPWETEADLRETLLLLSRFPMPYELIVFPLMFYPGTDLALKAQSEGLITIDGTQSERIRRHQFKLSFMNRLVLLLDQCARREVRIGPAEMRVITSPLLRRIGVSEWRLKTVIKRLERASYCAPAEGKTYIDFCEDSFSA